MEQKYEQVIDLAREAGHILMKHFKGELDVATKSDEYDLVTNADLESNTFLVQGIQKIFPDDQILSEEEDPHLIDYTGRVWMVDPLDGTKYFVKQHDGFSVLIGLCVNGIPEFGVAYLPARDILYFAERNKGAFKVSEGKKEKIHVSDTESLQEATMRVRIRYGEDRPLDWFEDSFDVQERIPGGAHAFSVAEGKGDFVLNTTPRAGKWDTCTREIILTEAGGVLTDYQGKALDYMEPGTQWQRCFVMSNGKLHQKILDHITEQKVDA